MVDSEYQKISDRYFLSFLFVNKIIIIAITEIYILVCNNYVNVSLVVKMNFY